MLTRDHVIPLGAGGRDHWQNIVKACVDCNGSRGAVLSHAFVIADARAGRLTPKALRRLRKRLPEIHQLRDDWVRMELDRLGTSFTETLDLSLPCDHLIRFNVYEPPAYALKREKRVREQLAHRAWRRQWLKECRANAEKFMRAEAEAEKIAANPLCPTQCHAIIEDAGQLGTG